MDFNDCAKALKRYIWMIIAIAVIASFTSWTVSQYLLQPLYKSTATILVNGKICSNYADLNLVLLDDNYIKAIYNIAHSETVAQNVINKMKLGWTVKYFRKLISVEADYETGFIEISAETADPELSADIINHYIEALEYQVCGNILELNIDILDAPKIAKKPSKPNIMLNVLLSLAGGIMTGILLALIFESAGYRKTKKLIFDKLPSLLVMGYLPEITKRKKNKLRLFYDGALKAIRTNLEYILENEAINTVMITSPKPSEGKTSVAINIALSFAQLEKNVLIIDCNFDKPGLSKIYNSSIDKKPDEESGFRRIDKYWVKPVSDLGIDVISDCMGPRNRNSDNSAFLKHLLRIMKKNYELIIVDCPSVLTGEDALMISRLVRNVIIVADYRRLSHQLLEESMQKLTQTGSNILGIVINRMPAARI